MKKILLIGLIMSFLTAVPILWAAENQPPQEQPYPYSGYERMGPGMMGPGSGYHGQGSGMMGYGGHMSRGMGPDQQGWQNMTPEQQGKWQRMRADFLRDTLSLRQELSAKQMELEVLWDQQNPDPKKIETLSNRITELRANLEQKHNAYLFQCRREFGNLGWTCPGGGWRGY
ncbi:MAG: periplasmic heavy metal sensor [Deltaproteobacteria bacterium]|nr:periplasmic heavy metal sensor [Deltaproteobacteria bacterium]